VAALTPVLGLHHVQLAAPPGCEEDARRFFGELLGLEELPKPESLAGRGGVWFRAGAQELHVGVERDFSPARKAHPAFAVADVDALRSRLEAAGVATEDAPGIPGLARFYVADPWGNRLELTAAPRR
jgi:catechol 2,3-dioxygenase-like lactoylglutathione lyase family enzyme